VIVLGQRAVYDVATAVIALVTLVVLLRFKIPEPIVIVLTGIVGLLVFPGLK